MSDRAAAGQSLAPPSALVLVALVATLWGEEAIASFTVSSAVSSTAAFTTIAEHDSTLSRPTDTPFGVDEVFGASPSTDPVYGGVVSSTSDGKVFFYRKSSASGAINTTGELVHRNPSNRFVPAAVCAGVVAVAESARLALFAFNEQSSAWELKQSIVNASGSEMFPLQRFSRRVAFHCDGAKSFIAASSGGGFRGTSAEFTFKPRIYVFRVNGSFPAFGPPENLNLDTFVVPPAAANGASDTKLFGENYIYNAGANFDTDFQTGRSALERIAVTDDHVVSLAAYFPNTLYYVQGMPLFLWDLQTAEGSGAKLWTTRGDRACSSSSARSTANVGLAVHALKDSSGFPIAHAVMVGCPAESGSAPQLEVFAKFETTECDTAVFSLSKALTVSAATIPGFPGFSVVDSFTKLQQRRGSSLLNDALFSNNTAPGVAVVHGSPVRGLVSETFRIVVGDPGFDDPFQNGFRDTGRAFILEITGELSFITFTTEFSAKYVSAVAPTTSEPGEMFGALAAAAVTADGVNTIVMPAPRRPAAAMRVASLAQASNQVLEAPGPLDVGFMSQAPYVPFLIGSSLDATGRWLASTEGADVVLFSNADAVDGFGASNSTTQGEVATRHSKISLGDHPFQDGQWPSMLNPNFVYRGTLLVRFLPASGAVDARPRLVVVGPRAQTQADSPPIAWELRVFVPSLKTGATSGPRLDFADPEDIEWVLQGGVFDLPSGYSPCSALYSPCGSDTDNCFTLADDVCANRIQVLELPSNASTGGIAADTLSRQTAAGGAARSVPVPPLEATAVAAGAGRPLPGCEDGAALALPDAAGTPSIVLVCIHGYRQQPAQAGGAAASLLSGLVPAGHSSASARIVLGLACSRVGVGGCVNTAARNGTTQRTDLTAGVRLESGILAGELFVGANNDANRLELFRFSEDKGKFVEVAMAPGTQPSPETVHPVACHFKQDLAFLSHADAIVAGTDGQRQLGVFTISLNSQSEVSIAEGSPVEQPSEVVDECNAAVFGSSIMAPHSLVAQEGIVAVMTSGAGGPSSCSKADIVPGLSEFLTIFTVAASSLRRAAILDDGRDALATTTVASMSREAQLVAEGSPAALRAAETVRPATVLVRSSMDEARPTQLRYLLTSTLEGIGSFSLMTHDPVSAPLDDTGLQMRTGAWAMARTGQSLFSWNMAHRVASGTGPARREELFGGSPQFPLEPVEVLRAGSGVPRFFVQTAGGIAQLDRRVTAVSLAPTSSDSSRGSLLDPLKSLETAVRVACAETPAMCQPVVIIGRKRGGGKAAQYSAEAAATSVAAYDAARTAAGAEDLLDSQTILLSLSSQWSGANVTIKGAGMDATRLVLHPTALGSESEQQPLSVGGIVLEDLTIHGGVGIRPNGAPGLNGGGVVTVTGSAAKRSALRLSRVRMVEGLSASDGGGIAASFADVTIVDSVLANLRAQRAGGAVWLGLSSTAVVVRTTMTGCVAEDQSGGAMAVTSDSVAVIDQGHFADSSAGNSGGALSASASSLFLLRSELRGNVAASSGGAVEVAFGRLVGWQTVFALNSASGGDGGAVSLAQSSGRPEKTSRLIDCSMLSNTAAAAGGALRVQTKSTIATLRCGFAYNIAGSEGGAVAVYSSTAKWTDGGSRIHANTAATAGGGAAITTNAAAEVWATELTGNTAAQGAGLACWGNSHLLGDYGARSADFPYAETSAELSLRTVQSVSQLPSVELSGGIASTGAGIHALACNGTLQRPAFTGNTAGVGGRRLAVASAYARAVGQAADKRARARGADPSPLWSVYEAAAAGVVPSSSANPLQRVGAAIGKPDAFQTGVAIESVFSPQLRLAGIPAGQADPGLPSTAEAMDAKSVGVLVSDVNMVSQQSQGGAGLFASTLQSSDSQLTLSSASFANNSAVGGSGGCIFAAGVADDDDCAASPSVCYLERKAADKGGYLRLSESISLGSCLASRGPAVYWAHVPFEGVSAVAAAGELSLIPTSSTTRLLQSSTSLSVTAHGAAYVDATLATTGRTAAAGPLVETAPLMLRTRQGGSVAASVPPSGQIAGTTTAVIEVEKVDAYGSRGFKPGFTVVVSAARSGGSARLTGLTSFPADPNDGIARVSGVGLEAAAGAVGVTVKLGLSPLKAVCATGHPAVDSSQCAAGTVAGPSRSFCVGCDAGFVASSTEAKCDRCPEGRYSGANASSCLCPQGTLAHPNRTRCMACTSRGVKCTASAFSVDDGFWWTPGYLQTDIDVDGSPWMYLPPGAPMHTCPTTKACNVTLNNVLARARAAAASLARTNQTLTSRRQAVAQLLQASLAETGGGVSCSEGHVGPRCAVCDAGYSRVSGNSDCVPCLDSGYNWAVVAAGLVIVTGLASFLVNNTYKSNVKGKAGSNVTPGLIRIIANYLKIQSTLGDFRARAPAVIMAIRNGASTVSSGIPLDIGPVACAFGLSFERQLLGAVAMPVVIIVGVSFLCALLFLRAACCPWFCQSAITILFFLVYSMLVKQVFTAWRLYDEPIEDKWYLAADFGVSTDSPAYSRIVIVAVVGVVLWVVGIPALAVWLLYRNRHRLLDDDFAASFAFLYAGYNIGTAGQVNEAAIQQARTVVRKLKDLTDASKLRWPPSSHASSLGAKHSRHKSLAMSRGKNVAFLEDIVDQFETTVSGQSQSWWFWEVVVLARLVAVTIVAIFVEDVFVQSYLALGIVIASTVAQLAAQPYSDSSLNFAETMGLLTILVTQMGSLLWALDTTELAKLDDVAVTIVLIVVNVAVLVVFVVMLILSVLGEHRILRIPVVGERLATAFFRERDLRRQFLLARNRRQAVNEEHKSSNAMAAVQAKASRQGSSAVAISTRASSRAKPAASPPGSATP
ncbi:hypothetical protein FNF31_05780 [Cafeteria roenbergensis]|uniref:Uncharacterized protein n=1 Tax=Cafeteria roenbergensis TaxID=33653 RepID=A0A5A8CWJ9_CAFRO|nr:hypothetical protein FNF31_05780 [Cafeteria roenbergensis]